VVCLTADRRRQAASVHFALLTRENRSVADVSIGVVISSATTTPQRVQFPIVTSSIDFCRLPPLCAPLSCPVIVVIVRNPLSRVDRHALQRTRSWILVILNLITVLGCSWSSSWHYFLGDRTVHTGFACWLLYLMRIGLHAYIHTPYSGKSYCSTYVFLTYLHNIWIDFLHFLNTTLQNN